MFLKTKVDKEIKLNIFDNWLYLSNIKTRKILFVYSVYIMMILTFYETKTFPWNVQIHHTQELDT